tara:strand:- start:441 stop:1163 length:723 start_codon:yes stop_codon:yes gene_type:complete
MKLGDKTIKSNVNQDEYPFQDLKLVFALPGDNFSGKFLTCWTELMVACIQQRVNFAFSNRQSPNVFFVRNMCLNGDTLRGPGQKPFKGEVEYDYIMWIDSDQVFTVDQFFNLLFMAQSKKLDIVSGVYMMSDGKHFATVIDWDTKYFAKHGTFQFLQPKDIKEKTDLIEVAYTGFGWMLVRKGVFESLKYPWFMPKAQKIGKAVDFASEDASWCQRVRKRGYKIYIDPRIRVGHEKRIVL